MNDCKYIYLYLLISILFDAEIKYEIVCAKLSIFSFLHLPVNKSFSFIFLQFTLKGTDMIVKSTYK